ncbi:MAG TPA: ATP-dependent DNA ligase [Candidatus Limnocylindrales bacterium]|nr:ATP-dependent DNA ligase [Candidatus Limnocylindrales bacterium]
MRRWSELAERVAATTRTSEKTALLAEYLRTLDDETLPIAVTFLTGRPFPESDQRATGIGWATIATAVSGISGADRDALSAAYDRHSDLAASVGDVLAEYGHAPDPEAAPSLEDVAGTFAAIERASGPAAKASYLATLLGRADPKTARGIVRVLSGELRIGLREGLVEAALAQAFDRPLDAVKRAGMLTGDIGRTATLARTGELGGAALAMFHPLKFMLASPAEDAAEILTRLGPTVWVEDKYDGIRCQLHKQGTEVRLYSRDLHDVSGQFPEVVAGARHLPWDGILDGEILAWRDGTVLPFVSLQARLGRKSPPPSLLEEVPVIYVAFDLLGHGEEALLEVPLEQRRRRLEQLELPLAGTSAPGATTNGPTSGAFALSHLVSADSIDALEAAFAEARARRNEGLMVKDPKSIYSPGRRGYGWLKMKKALATIDCVVVGVEVGHGKRHGVLSDYTFAVRDEARGQLVTIGKAYSGLTDAEIAKMTTWFEEHTISQHGRYRVVEPKVVVEVAFDVILRSNRHKSGFALRFPRIAHLRLDKDPLEADTLETVTQLFEGLQAGAEHLVTAGARKSAAAASAEEAASKPDAPDA